MASQPKYTVRRNRSQWVVLKMEYNGNAASGTKIDSFDDRLIAIKEMYKLNGWNPKNIK